MGVAVFATQRASIALRGLGARPPQKGGAGWQDGASCEAAFGCRAASFVAAGILCGFFEPGRAVYTAALEKTLIPGFVAHIPRAILMPVCAATQKGLFRTKCK